jgi:hypothetical protein
MTAKIFQFQDALKQRRSMQGTDRAIDGAGKPLTTEKVLSQADLRSYGYRCALDDFGFGYSCFPPVRLS